MDFVRPAARLAGRLVAAAVTGISMLAFFYVVGGGWLILPPGLLFGGR